MRMRLSLMGYIMGVIWAFIILLVLAIGFIAVHWWVFLLIGVFAFLPSSKDKKVIR
jgi:hypothetical protein